MTGEKNQSSEREALHGEESPWMSGLARFVLRRRWLVLSFIIAVSVLMCALIFKRLRVDNSTELFAPKASQVTTDLERYRDVFGRDDFFLITARAEAPMGVFEGDFLERLKALQEAALHIDVPVTTLGERWRDRELKRAGEVRPDPGASDARAESERADAEEWELESEWGGDLGWGEEAGGSLFVEALSLLNARRSVGGAEGFQLLKWFEPLPVGAARLRRGEQALRDPLIRQRLVNEQGDFTTILLRSDFMSEADAGRVAEALIALLKDHEGPGFQLNIAGPSVVNHELNRVVLGDMQFLVMLSLSALLIALAGLYRRFLMVLGPIAVVLLSVLWTMGVMAGLNLSLNLLSSILPTFLLCVGLGDSIHLQSLYQSARREGFSQRDAIVRACGLTGLPVLFTSLTTMIGLFSFRFASVLAIQEMGLAGGIGVSFALLLSLLLLPITLSWQREQRAPQGARAEGSRGSGSRGSGSRGSGSLSGGAEEAASSLAVRGEEGLIDRGLRWLVSRSETPTRRRVTLGAGLLLALLSLWGVSHLEVYHDDLENLPPNLPIKASLQEIDRELGGSAPGELLIESTDPLGVGSLSLLRALDTIKAAALEYRDRDGVQLVGHVMSLSDIVKELRRALLGDPRLGLPEGQEEASQILSLFELQDPADLKRISSLDRRITHLSMQVKWREASYYGPLIEHLDEAIKGAALPGVEIRPTGGIYLAQLIVSSLLSDLTRSFSAAFLVITLLMVLMLRDLKLGALAMVPNLLPILIMLGALGLLGIPLDLNNLLIASIALGIAVDDTIHFLHHFKVARQAGATIEGAIDASMRHAGRAMLGTSLILSAGFCVYLFASTIALQRFGALIASVVLVAFLIDLLICPALLRWAYQRERAAEADR